MEPITISFITKFIFVETKYEILAKRTVLLYTVFIIIYIYRIYYDRHFRTAVYYAGFAKVHLRITHEI